MRIDAVLVATFAHRRDLIRGRKPDSNRSGGWKKTSGQNETNPNDTPKSRVHRVMTSSRSPEAGLEDDSSTSRFGGIRLGIEVRSTAGLMTNCVHAEAAFVFLLVVSALLYNSVDSVAVHAFKKKWHPNIPCTYNHKYRLQTSVFLICY